MESAPRTSNTTTVLQLVLGIISLGLVLITTLALVIISFASRQLDQATLQSVRNITWISAALGVPALLSIIYSARRIFPRSALPARKSSSFLIATIFLAGSVLLAWLTTLPAFEPVPAWIRSLLSIVLVVVTAWWVVVLGSFRLPRLTGQKQWGLVNFANFVTMPVILVIETIVFALGVGLLIAWVMQKPEYAYIINQVQNLMYVNFDTMPLIIEELTPLLQDPAVITAVLMAFALVIPLIEELFKPLAVWFFIKRQWSPAEGFVAGMICGAAFSAVESALALASISGESWLPLIAARAGTALLHITTAGLSGWALTSAWRDGRYLRVGFTYLLVVLLHGIWNFLAISVAYTSLVEGNAINFQVGLASVAPWIMGGLVVVFLALLVGMNLQLRRQQISTLPPQMPPPLPE